MKRLSLDPAEIPADGALGLLAYGDLALEAWRDKRTAVEGADWRERIAAEAAREEASLQGARQRSGDDPD